MVREMPNSHERAAATQGNILTPEMKGVSYRRIVAGMKASVTFKTTSAVKEKLSRWNIERTPHAKPAC